MADERKNLESEPFRKLFIGGLNCETTDDTLRDYFEHWGEVVDCVVMKDPITRRSRGFGFVTFKKSHMVDDAQKARPHKIDNKVVETKRAMPREDSTRPEAHITCTKAYISGIRNEHNETDLREYFSKYGEVQSVEIITDHVTNKKRGFAFVTFTDYDCVDRVVLYKSHSIKGFRCDARKALSKEEMIRLKVADEPPSGDRGRGRGGLEARGGRSGSQGRGRFEEHRGMGFGSRDGFVDREGFGSREEFRGREGLWNREGFGEREGFGGGEDFRGYEDYRGRDNFRVRDSFGGREGFDDRGGFGHRKGFVDRENFGGREGFAERDSYGGREGFGVRDSYGGREGFGERERFSGRDGFDMRDNRFERDVLGGRDGSRRGRDDYEGPSGFGSRGNYNSRTEYGEEGFGSRNNYGGSWDSSGRGVGNRGLGDRDDRFIREDSRGGNGYNDRSYGNGGPGSGFGSGFGSGREDYDARQGSGFGTGYGSSRGGGPVKDNGYSARSAGPYGGGFGSTGGMSGGRENFGPAGPTMRDDFGGGSGRDGANFSERVGAGFGDYDERRSTSKIGFSRGRGGAGVRGGASRGGFGRW